MASVKVKSKLDLVCLTATEWAAIVSFIGVAGHENLLPGNLIRGADVDSAWNKARDVERDVIAAKRRAGLADG